MIDRLTGKPVQVGSVLVRRHQGRTTRYEITAMTEAVVQVRKLGAQDQWVYMSMEPQVLQLQTN